MAGTKREWREVVRVEKRWEERTSVSRRTVSWSTTPVHTVFLSCGHVLTRRGFSDPPKIKAVCKRCESGQAPIPLDVEPGRVEAEPPDMPAFLMAVAQSEASR